MSAPASFSHSGAAFFGGVRSALGSVFFPVLAGTYIGIGALAHESDSSRLGVSWKFPMPLAAGASA